MLEGVPPVSYTHLDPNLSNNTDTQTTQVDERADLSVVKLGSPQSAEPGGLVTYTLTAVSYTHLDVYKRQPQRPAKWDRIHRGWLRRSKRPGGRRQSHSIP